MCYFSIRIPLEVPLQPLMQLLAYQKLLSISTSPLYNGLIRPAADLSPHYAQLGVHELARFYYLRFAYARIQEHHV